MYRCRDETLERTVAVKALRHDRADETSRRRLVREARIAAGLRHDNVVAVHEVVDPRVGPPYLVMEYIDGPTLSDLIRTERRLDLRRAANLLAEAAAGLSEAHAAGLVHRDVKPSNILIDRASNRAKITDFGLAGDADIAGGCHPRRRSARHARLHEPRAGQGRSHDRRPIRHPRPGSDALRSDHGRGAVSRRSADDPRADPRRRSQAAPQAQRRDSARPRDDLPSRDGQGARKTLRLGPRFRRRPSPLAQWRAHQGSRCKPSGTRLVVGEAKPQVGALRGDIDRLAGPFSRCLRLRRPQNRLGPPHRRPRVQTSQYAPARPRLANAPTPSAVEPPRTNTFSWLSMR